MRKICLFFLPTYDKKISNSRCGKEKNVHSSIWYWQIKRQKSQSICRQCPSLEVLLNALCHANQWHRHRHIGTLFVGFPPVFLHVWCITCQGIINFEHRLHTMQITNSCMYVVLALSPRDGLEILIGPTYGLVLHAYFHLKCLLLIWLQILSLRKVKDNNWQESLLVCLIEVVLVSPIFWTFWQVGPVVLVLHFSPISECQEKKLKKGIS